MSLALARHDSGLIVARVSSVGCRRGLALVASGQCFVRCEFRPWGGWCQTRKNPPASDPRLGWTLVPARTGHSTIAGRDIDYSIDPAGYRVRRVDEPVDPEQPTILFIGESVMFGEGLTWEESVPAQVGARMGIQSANLAVHGFSSDQAYLRLVTELPRFRRPVAVVSLFMPALFGRNLDDNRPRLGPGLTWLPPEQHGKLASLAKLLVPYRKTDTVERGVARASRDGQSGACALSEPLIVVRSSASREQAERAIRRRILTRPGCRTSLSRSTRTGAWRGRSTPTRAPLV